LNKKVIESICQNAKLKKILNLRQMSKVESLRNRPSLFGEEWLNGSP